MTHTSHHNPCVLAIGNFDGVHLGHMALLQHARELADVNDLPLHVLTFEPHPRQFFAPDAPPFRLTNAPTRERLLLNAGAHKVIALPFDASLARMSADDFIQQILVAQLNAAYVVVGADFQFGANRHGNVDTLTASPHFTTHAMPLKGDDMMVISSTRIRQALLDGNLPAANAMLGHNWGIEGEVIHGDKRGREIGFPTANIAFTDTLCPAYGIYAVWVDTGDGLMHKGAANIGLRPMFALQKPLLEVHLFDFNGDLYGKTLKVTPVTRLRGEENFNSLDALIAQISNDCTQARDILISPHD